MKFFMMSCIKIVIRNSPGNFSSRKYWATSASDMTRGRLSDTHTKLVCVFYMHCPNYTYILNTNIVKWCSQLVTLVSIGCIRVHRHASGRTFHLWTSRKACKRTPTKERLNTESCNRPLFWLRSRSVNELWIAWLLHMAPSKDDDYGN